MGQLPIFSFDELYKETVWGGRRLEALLGKRLPGDGPIGESWEVVDLPDDQSIVSAGPYSGVSLEGLRQQYSPELLGGAHLLKGRFPLLLKFIDAQRTLSVQVHPDETACARLGGGARPKTEAWYILGAEQGAVLYVGLRDGVDRESFTQALHGGKVEDLLHRLVVQPGDFVFLPSGTIHAIGEGIVLAEVQQSSDTTYRVFDWNRVGLDGKPRALHVPEALESIAFDTHGVPPHQDPPSGRPGIACAEFIMEKILWNADESVACEGAGPLILMGIGGDGEVIVRAREQRSTLRRGETRLVPAACAGQVILEAPSGTEVLATRIPV